MKLQYRPAAISDIGKPSDYIADVLKNRSAANRLKSKILAGVSLLKDNPYMGTPLSSRYDGVPEDIRFLVISKQLVFYKVTETGIEVIRVLDGRTDYLVHLFGAEEQEIPTKAVVQSAHALLSSRVQP